jgi:cell division protein ZapE
MSLLEYYQQQVQAGQIEADALQQQALQVFEQFFAEYKLQHQKKWWRLWQRRPLIRGIYLWGSVGIGKTWLMDLFYQQLPGKRKVRQHFHVFMRSVHQRLTALQGVDDPLKHIAQEWADKVDVICFDEFFVNDITDAMILGNLFTALFNERVSLIATSNVPPENLYRNGLQRELFLPAIALLQSQCAVYHLDSHKDYRVRTLENAGVYWCLQQEGKAEGMRALFQQLVGSEMLRLEDISVEGRAIANWGHTDDIVGFDFNVLCHEPRSQRDYLVLSEQFSTVFLSHVPEIGDREHDKITYFIQLIDILYDAHVKLVLSTTAEKVLDIYRKGPFSFEFERTQSRLTEMQTHDYLARGR